MIVVLRGHIRDSFNNDQLYHLMRELHDGDPGLQIYISTYNIVQSSISWRQIEQIDTPVDAAMIRRYFRDLTPLIQKIEIHDDSAISLVGRVEGPIGTNCGVPLIGWKNYWYCKYQIIAYLHSILKERTQPIFTLRFDLFLNSNRFDMCEIQEFIERRRSGVERIHFMRDHHFPGLDNIYVGTIDLLYQLTSHFHKNLDSILERYPDIHHQECLVMHESLRCAV